MNWLTRRLYLFAALIAAAPAFSQNYSTLSGEILPQTVYPSADQNGVDLGTAGREVYGPSLTIGNPAHGGIEFRPVIAGWSINSHFPTANSFECPDCYMSGFEGSSNMTAQLTFTPGNAATVSTSTKIAYFKASPNADGFSGFSERSPVIGRTLTFSAIPLTNNMTYDGVTYASISFSETFVDSDGTQYIFSSAGQPGNPAESGYPGCLINGAPLCSYSIPISRIVKPNGDTLDFYYSVGGHSASFPFPSYALIAIVSNHGYMISFRGNVAVNLSANACSPIATCSFTSASPTLTYAVLSPYSAPNSYTDSTGAITKISQGITGPGVTTWAISVARPNGRNEVFVYDNNPGNQRGACAAPAGPCPFMHLVSYKDGVNTWNYQTTYTQSPVASYFNTNILRTDPSGRVRTTVASPSSGRIVSDTDELGQVTTISAIPPGQPNEGRVLNISYPEGNTKSFNNYDARGNIWQQVIAPKPGSSLASEVTNYVFPTTCTNWKICNKPTSVTDPKGNMTSFTYDPNSGEVLTETLPPDASGIKPVKRYAYTQMYASISNGAGGYVRVATPAWLLTQIRTCRATATVGNACSGGSTDEVVTNYYYGPQSGPNNLELRGTSVSADGTTRNMCYQYDSLGNKISETKPLAGVSVCP